MPRSENRSCALSAALGVAALTVVLPGALLGQRLETSLSLSKGAYRQGEPLEATFTVSNPSDTPVEVLTWNTPLEEKVVGKPFVVSRNGEERPYSGGFVYRLSPGPDAYVRIDAQGSVSAVVDLAKGYDLSDAGAYEVRLRFDHLTVTEPYGGPRRDRAGTTRRERAKTPPAVAFEMLDAGTPSEVAISPAQRPACFKPEISQLNFVLCSSASQPPMQEAFDDMANGVQIVNGAVSGWSSSSDWDSAAAEYFGAFSQQSLSTVQTIIGDVDADADDPCGNTVIDIDCTTGQCGNVSCSDPGTIALTCGAPTIYVCNPSFFNLPTVDKVPSMESVLYHELTHWAGAIDDPCACKVTKKKPVTCAALADSSPGTAVDNAYSHEYFGAYQGSGDDPCGVEHAAAAVVLLAGLTLGRRTYLARCARRGQDA